MRGRGCADKQGLIREGALKDFKELKIRGLYIMRG